MYVKHLGNEFYVQMKFFVLARYLKWLRDYSRLKEKVANQGEALRVGTSRF